MAEHVNWAVITLRNRRRFLEEDRWVTKATLPPSLLDRVLRMEQQKPPFLSLCKRIYSLACVPSLLDKQPPLLIPRLQIKLKGLRLHIESSCVVIQRHFHTRSLRNMRGPSHARNQQMQGILGNIHARANAATEAKAREVLEVGELVERFAVSRIFGRQPALRVEDFRFRVQFRIAMNSPVLKSAVDHCYTV